METDTQTVLPQEAPAAEVEQTTPAVTPAVTTPASFDPKSLPPEAQEYFSKKYEGFDRLKGMSEEYERLLRAPEFRSWYEGMRQPHAQQAQPKPFEITDDQFVAAMGNKEQFAALVSSLAERIASEKFAPQIQSTKQEIELAKRTAEINSTVAKYPDFMELDKRGLIEPYLRKYQSISFEDAYWLAKRHVFNEEVDKKARGIVEEKKAASVERPGNPPGAKSHRVRAKTRLEAMEIAAAAHREGREIPDIEID